MAHAPARQLSDADRRSIGEYLSGRNFMGSNAGEAARCRTYARPILP